jgi:hypothetical protein
VGYGAFGLLLAFIAAVAIGAAYTGFLTLEDR